jgi:hypothetical protein
VVIMSDTPQQIRVKLIDNEIKRLTAIYKEIDLSNAKQRTIKGLIEEAAFMKVTIADLKDTINKDGPIDEMQQGDYFIMRQSPAVQTYNSMIQRYTTVYKELLNVLPPEVKKEETDGFDDFVNGK